MKIIKISKTAPIKAIKVINAGGVIVCPTDTVYGLICDASNKKAVEKIFKIKKRPKTKPLGVFVKDIKQAKKIAIIDERAERFLKKNTPGKITVILKKRSDYDLADLVGNKDTVGIRIVKNKFINELLKKFNKPLAQTSANISGQPATTKIEKVLEQLKNQKIKPDLVIDAGNLPQNRPSKIVDLTTQKMITLNRQ